MENEFKEYWIDKNVDWHEVIPHHYHVSAIGIGHQDLEPTEHYGPCLRQAFYKIINPLPNSVSSQGNLTMGNILHAKLQEIHKKNVPQSIIEFPLYFKSGNVSVSGSIDIVEFKKNTFVPTELDVIDIKTASQYTLPKFDDSYNPTHFAQVYLYAYMLQNFYLHNTCRIVNLKVIYIDKHNAGTYIQSIKYDNELGGIYFTNFIERCKHLDKCLEEDELPIKEPMRWCKYCDYKVCCNSDSKTSEDLKVHTHEEVEEMYTEKTGKNPLWRGNWTNAFKEFRRGFKIK